MLPAGTLPVVPACFACTGATLVLLGLSGGTNTSAPVMNCTLFFVETKVPLGITTGLVPLLVKVTMPDACTVPTVDDPEACPGKVRLLENVSVCAGIVLFVKSMWLALLAVSFNGNG